MKIVWIALGIGAIVLISRMSKDGKVGKRNNDRANLGEKNSTSPSEVKINKNQAKKVFLQNIDKFAPILSSLNNDSFDCKLWTELIVTVNDFHLTELWKKYVSAADVKERWKRLLASWQIKSDNCKSFTCLREDNILSYTLPNGDSLVMGEKYKVEVACWVYTDEDSEGNVNKRLISKGVVIPFQE